MSDFDDMVARLTRRLRRDPELQREISRELLTHLEDAAAEGLHAGMSEDQARQNAIESMGDEHDVAERLYQANRRRIRLRQTVKWASGLVVMPAAGVLSISLLWSLAVYLAMTIMLLGTSQYPNSAVSSNAMVRSIADRAFAQRTTPLSADQLALLTCTLPGRTEIAAARRLAEAHPGDHALWANYAILAVTSAGNVPAMVRIDRVPIQDAIAICRQGEAREADNALYPLLIAYLCFEASTRQSATDIPAGFNYRFMSDAPEPATFCRYTVTDPAMHQQALRELHIAAGKPRLDTGQRKLALRQLEKLPPPAGLDDVLVRVRLEASIPLLCIAPLRSVLQHADATAIDHARRDEQTLALEINADSLAVCRLAARQAQFVVELLDAFSNFDQSLIDKAIIYHMLGRHELRDATLARLATDGDVYRSVREKQNATDRLRWRSQHAGLLESSLGGVLTRPAEARLATERKAEYGMADELFVGLSMLMLIVTAALVGFVALLRRLRAGRLPSAAFIGWRAIVRTALISVVLPLGLYALYAYSPLGGRSFNVWVSYDRLLVEYAVLLCAIVVLFRWQAGAALRRRAAELDAPEIAWRPLGPQLIIFGIVLAIAAVVCIWFWHYDIRTTLPIGQTHTLASLAMAALLVTYATVCAIAPGVSPSTRSPSPLRVFVDVAVLVSLATGIWFMIAVAQERDMWRMLRWLPKVTPAIAVVAVLTAAWVARRRSRNAAPKIAPKPVPVACDPVFGRLASLTPALAALALALALFGALPLRWAEARAARAMALPADQTLLMSEMDQSTLLPLRDRMQ